MTKREGLTAAALGAVGLGVYGLAVRGSLTLDVGVGRTTRPLGPMAWRIAAPRELVFEVISAPYLGRTPRALRSKLKILERSTDMVLAEHYTRAGPLVTTTLETVQFEPPERVQFRLVRGPVPYVVEQFKLRESETGTDLEYHGELGADFWILGRLWGAAVARSWEKAVRASLNAIAAESDRRAARMRSIRDS